MGRCNVRKAPDKSFVARGRAETSAPFPVPESRLVVRRGSFRGKAASGCLGQSSSHSCGL